MMEKIEGEAVSVPPRFDGIFLLPLRLLLVALLEQCALVNV